MFRRSTTDRRPGSHHSVQESKVSKAQDSIEGEYTRKTKYITLLNGSSCASIPSQGKTSHFAMSATAMPHDSGGLQLQTIQNTSLDDARNVASAEQPTPLSRKVILKLLSSGFSFFVAGTIDGSLGPLIPYMLRSYNVGTSFISIM